MTGFFIRTIRVIGPDLKPAEVTFKQGLNVITGASDTGKSYILQCIDYMLGGGVVPENLDEARGYETILMEYEDHSRKRSVLERSLRDGGDFRHYAIALADWTPESAHTFLRQDHAESRTDTVSHVFLELSGLTGKRILTKAQGDTKPVSFRDVCRFALVKEDQVISDRSPVLAGDSYYKESSCVSMFNVFLTGRDYNAIIAPPDIKLSKARWEASNELLDSLILESQSKAPPPVPVGMRTTIAEYDERIAVASSSIEQTIVTINESVANRRAKWTSLTSMRSRRIIVGQLLGRFALLNQHYTSDLERLQFVEEGEFYLSQLPDAHCPVCGKLMDDHSKEHVRQEKPQAMQNAAKAESVKIQTHIHDLASTIGALENEAAALDTNIRAAERSIAADEESIRTQLEPRIKAERQNIEEITRAKEALLRAEVNANLVTTLTARRTALGTKPVQKRVKMADAAAIDTGEQRALFTSLESVLREWRYPNVGTVEFGKQWKLVINGKSYTGKGFRALIRSAFTIALMRHALSKGVHPGLVVIDSPLTSFKQKDEYQNSEDVKIGFYNHLRQTPDTQQIIIIENEQPPEELRAHLSHLHFSRAEGSGRFGFYPVGDDRFRPPAEPAASQA